MKVTILLLALSCAFTLAADHPAALPTTANLQSAIGNRQAEFVNDVDAIAIPQMLSYQGKLTDTLGVPVADTTYSVNFRLYSVPSGGSSFWNETQTVRTRGGLFSTLLGSVTPIDAVPDAGAAYLGMAADGGGELAPRLRIASAAYAYLSERAANSDMLQGRDTTTFSRSTHNHDATYVNEGQANSVTGAMLVDGTVATADVGDTAVTMAKLARAGATTGQVVKWTGSAWAPGPDNTGGGSGVTDVYQDTGIICVPNPITSTGNVKLDLAYGDARYVNEAQANSVTGAMIADQQVSSADIRDTTVNTAELKDNAVTSAKILDGAVTSADIRDTTVNTADIKDAAVTAPKLNQMGASSGQVMKWTGSAWAPGNDSIGGGAGDSAWARGTPDSVLFTIRNLGIARGGASNMLYGSLRYTHVNLGVACTTGMSGSNDAYATVGGGYGCTAKGTYTTVGGGIHGAAGANFATVGGGIGCSAGNVYATVAGGQNNTAGGGNSTVAGGAGNVASGPQATVGGGFVNLAEGDGAAVAGGTLNAARGYSSFVGGGYDDTARARYGVVGGGNDNLAGDEEGDTAATVAGGKDNAATDEYSFVGGGRGNHVTANLGTIGGGDGNTVSGSVGFVGGGELNTVNGTDAAVVGGVSNSAGGMRAFIGAGYGNSASIQYTVVGGGENNAASGAYSVVGGGCSDSVVGSYGAALSGYSNRVGGVWTDSASVIAGGWDNTATGKFNTIGGGRADSVSALYGVVSGGYSNLAGDATGDTAAVVAGGWNNSATGKFSSVVGGYGNTASGNDATTVGGEQNRACGLRSVVGGGYQCLASLDHSFVGGGFADTASALNTVVGGGERNKATGNYSTVGGGAYNTASGVRATVTGGFYCSAGGDYSTVIGGANDTCAANYSLVAGSSVRARSGAQYTFAFGEGCTTSVPRAVIFYHSGAATKLGVGVQTPTHNIDVQGGAYCNGTNWVNGSSRKLKTDISALTPEQMRAVLEELERTQVVRYRYKSEASGEEHIGLIAEDAPELLATPDRDGINTADADGVLIAAVQALYEQSQIQQAEIEQLKAELEQQKR